LLFDVRQSCRTSKSCLYCLSFTPDFIGQCSYTLPDVALTVLRHICLFAGNPGEPLAWRLEL
jgi:hypothetical protein